VRTTNAGLEQIILIVGVEQCRSANWVATQKMCENLYFTVQWVAIYTIIIQQRT